MNLLVQDVEEHSLRSVLDPLESLSRIHFNPELEIYTNKSQDLPDYLHQLTLEIINQIPDTAIQIYTDGSRNEHNSCGSGVFIKAPCFSRSIKIRNPDFCSVFRSELIAIDVALDAVKSVRTPQDIWILSDSRSAIQHLSNWTKVGDKTTISIIATLRDLSENHEIFFQWIPSHIGIFGNEVADLLAKDGTSEELVAANILTSSEICSKNRASIQLLWKTPPTHAWYNRQAPGGALTIKADRSIQTTISRLASGHIRCLSFVDGNKTFPICIKCSSEQASPEHLINCAGLDKDDIYTNPLLVHDFLKVFRLIDLV